jgi:hypothetical protein
MILLLKDQVCFPIKVIQWEENLRFCVFIVLHTKQEESEPDFIAR